MKVCWRRPSRISRTSDTLNITTTAMTTASEMMPPAISQRLLHSARVAVQFSRITRTQPISIMTVSSTAMVLSTMGTEMERFSGRGIGCKHSASGPEVALRALFL